MTFNVLTNRGQAWGVSLDFWPLDFAYSGDGAALGKKFSIRINLLRAERRAVFWTNSPQICVIVFAGCGD
jgi:hypothetical protein